MVPGGGGVPAPGVCSQGVPGGDPPDGYCCGRYASYCNAFLSHLVIPCCDNKNSLYNTKTRMHSSRMRTVLGGCLPRGVCLHSGGCLSGGCLPGGVYPSMH